MNRYRGANICLLLYLMLCALCGIYSIGMTSFVRTPRLAHSQWSTLHQQEGQILILSDQG